MIWAIRPFDSFSETRSGYLVGFLQAGKFDFGRQLGGRRSRYEPQNFLAAAERSGDIDRQIIAFGRKSI